MFFRAFEFNRRMFSDPVNATVAARLVAEAPPKYEWKTFHNSNVLLQNAFSPEKGWRLLDGELQWLLLGLVQKAES